MNQTTIATMTDALQRLLDQSDAHAAFVCDSRGRIVTGAGSWQDETPALLRDLAPAVFPGTRRMAVQLQNPDETQQVSLPDDQLHIAILWLTEQYFLLVCFSRAIDPHAPPAAVVACAQALRALASGNDKA